MNRKLCQVLCPFCMLLLISIGICAEQISSIANAVEADAVVLEPADFRNEEGEFSVLNLPWLSSIRDAGALPWVSLESPQDVFSGPENNETWVLYSNVRPFALLGYTGDMLFEFHSDRLACIFLEIVVGEETLDSVFDVMKSAFTEQFGPPDNERKQTVEAAMHPLMRDSIVEMCQWYDSPRADGSFTTMVLRKSDVSVLFGFALCEGR